MATVEVKNLVKNYGSIEAVKGISFNVNEKETFGLIGPNGAGKTTVLRILSTLLTITSGSVKIMEFDLKKRPEEIRKLISYLPEDAGAYQQMGLGYYRTQAYQCGIDAYRKAIAIAPDATLAHNMLGYCSMSAGKFEEAVSAFQQLVEVAPEDPNSYDSLAEGYYQLGDTTKAIQYYQQALAVDSTFSNSYYMLGTIYQERGRRDDAIADLERYIQLDPGGCQAPNAQRQLHQLQPSSDVQEP